MPFTYRLSCEADAHVVNRASEPRSRVTQMRETIAWMNGRACDLCDKKWRARALARDIFEQKGSTKGGMILFFLLGNPLSLLESLPKIRIF